MTRPSRPLPGTRIDSVRTRLAEQMRRSVLDTCAELGGEAPLGAIRAALVARSQRNRHRVARGIEYAVERLVTDGKLRRVRRGLYRVAEKGRASA